MKGWKVALVVVAVVLLFAAALAIAVSLWIDSEQVYRLRDRVERRKRILSPFIDDPMMRPPREWLAHGALAASGKRIVFVAMIRDGSLCVANLRAKVRGIVPHFRDWSVVCLEDGSVDGTREEILTWRDAEPSGRVHLVDGALPGGDDGLPRMERMARKRNLYLDFLREIWWPSAGPDDVVAILDPDLDGAWSLQGFLSSVGFLQSGVADAVSASSIYTLPGVVGWFDDHWQHDPGAFIERNANCCLANFAAQKDWGVDSPLKRVVRFNHLVLSALIRRKLLPVCGAFSGLTLYRAEPLFGGRETARYGHAVCEHYGLAESMHRNGFSRTFINPFMRILRGGNVSDIDLSGHRRGCSAQAA